MKIGMEKVASMNFQSNNVPLVSKVPYIVTKEWMSAYNKEKYDGYYVMAHGNADDDFMPFIEKIKEELVKTDPDFKKLIVKVRANN